MPKLEILVNDENQGTRIDAFIAENSPLTRSYIQKLIKSGDILVNENKTVNRYKVTEGDYITINYEDNVLTDLKPENIPLEIVYEDEDLIVINKPKGLVVHPAPGHVNGTLVNALLYHCKELSSINGYFRPGIVHRIDKNTSGLIVCAKNNNTHNALALQLKDKTCFRKYYAIVKGVIENNEIEINAPIGRNPKNRQTMCVTDVNAKEAITLGRVLERYDDSTLLDVELKTGRTHQIRVHMSYIKHPVLNDSKYGKEINKDIEGQYLHAYYLSFIHPSTNERMEIKVDMPQYMKDYIKDKGGHYGEECI